MILYFLSIIIFATFKKHTAMLIMKFGGTSVGKPDRMKKIANLVLETPGKKVVVLSALSGTTNALVSIGDHLLANQFESGLQTICKWS